MQADPVGEVARAPPSVPALTPQLQLAEEWARAKGDQVDHGAGIFEPGRVEPVLRVHHGPAPIYVRDMGRCLQVVGTLALPAEFRASLRAMDEAARAGALSDLREALMACPRVGFTLSPRTATDITEIAVVSVDQTLRISASDPSTFNRFADAIQEAETILLRVADLVGLYGSAYHRHRTYSSTTPAPSELYL